MNRGIPTNFSRAYHTVSDNRWYRWAGWVVLLLVVLLCNMLAGVGFGETDDRATALFYQWFALHSIVLIPVLFFSFLTLPVRGYSVNRIREIIWCISLFQMITYSISVLIIYMLNGSFLPFTWYYTTILVLLWLGSVLIYLVLASVHEKIINVLLVLIYIFFLNFISLFFSRLMGFVFE